MIGIFLLQTDALLETKGIDGHGWDAVEDHVENRIYYLPQVKLTPASTIDPALNSPVKKSEVKKDPVLPLLIHFALISFCLLCGLMTLKGTSYPDYGHFSNSLICIFRQTSAWLVFRRFGPLQNEDQSPRHQPAGKGNSPFGKWQDKSNIGQSVIFVVFGLEGKEN